MLWLVLIACQEPFGADRHDLVGHRIAAVEVEVGAQGVDGRAALITDGRTYSDDPPRLRWWWVDDDAPWLSSLSERHLAALAELPPDGEGPEPSWPVAAGTLIVQATWGDGIERWAMVPRVDDTIPGQRPTGIDVQPLALDPASASEGALSLERRRDLAPGSEGPMKRMQALGVGDDDVVRWMATAGTFLELDAHTTDWAPGQLLVEEGTAVDYQPEEHDVVTVLALSMGDGAGRVRAVDLRDDDGTPGTWVEQRWVPGLSLDAPTVVRLDRDDDAPLGLRIAEIVDESPDPTACGGQLLPEALLFGRCSRSELVGVPVTLSPGTP